MDDLVRQLTQTFIRYTVAPCTLGLAAMAAIVLPGSGDDLSVTRLAVGCSMLLIFPAALAWPLLQMDKRRMRG